MVVLLAWRRRFVFSVPSKHTGLDVQMRKNSCKTKNVRTSLRVLESELNEWHLNCSPSAHPLIVFNMQLKLL